MWLVDTGCGYDLVSKRETPLIRRFVSKAKVPIMFHTANGPTRTENVANIYVKELDANITPSVIENTPSRSYGWLPVHGIGLHIYFAYQSISLRHSS